MQEKAKRGTFKKTTKTKIKKQKNRNKWKKKKNVAEARIKWDPETEKQKGLKEKNAPETRRH